MPRNLSVSLRVRRIFVAVPVLVFSLALTACGGGSGGGSGPRLLGGTIQGAPLSPTGVVTTFAGSLAAGSANGTGTAATFYGPWGITTDGTNLYVAEGNNCDIRQIVIATQAVTTLAGAAGTCGNTNGTGTAALFNNPAGITTDGTNVYVTDVNNDEIRQIVIASGVVTTLVGSGAVGNADGTGTAATFSVPVGLTTDGTNLYVSESGNCDIRKIVIATGVVTTLAGSTTCGSADGTGTAAQFRDPEGLTTDGTNLYVGDGGNCEVRKVVIASGVVTTLAGSTTCGSADGTGTAAQFAYPWGLATDGTNLYLADESNNEIRKIVIATGKVTTLAGSTAPGSSDGTGSAAQFNQPGDVTSDGTSLYVPDSSNNEIRKIQ